MSKEETEDIPETEEKIIPIEVKVTNQKEDKPIQDYEDETEHLDLTSTQEEIEEGYAD